MLCRLLASGDLACNSDRRHSHPTLRCPRSSGSSARIQARPFAPLRETAVVPVILSDAKNLSRRETLRSAQGDTTGRGC